MNAENRDQQTPAKSEPREKRKWLDCDPASPVREVAREALEGRLNHVPSLLETAVEQRFEVPDQVRQIRVATRRASTAINLFAEFASPAMVSRIARDLKKIRKVAGRMRDLDVLIANAERSNPENENLTFLNSRRSRAQLKLEKSYQKYIASGRLEENVRQLLQSLQTNTNGETPALFAAWASATLTKAGDVFFASWPITTAVESECEDFVALHNFRLQVKKLRYQLELLGFDAPRKRRRKVSRKLKKIQTSLGEVNDRDVAIQKIHRWMTKATPEERESLKRQLANEQIARSAAAKSFHEKWPTEARDKVKQQFDRMMGKPKPASIDATSCDSKPCSHGS